MNKSNFMNKESYSDNMHILLMKSIKEVFQSFAIITYETYFKSELKN